MAEQFFKRRVLVGGFDHVHPVVLGEQSPVVIQTMWKDRLDRECLEGDLAAVVEKKINDLWKLGCRVLRFAVPDLQSAEVLGELSRRVSMPLVADIHFDYKIALCCLDYPIAKIRINPGNIGSRERVHAVLAKAAEKNRPIRIGINAGSLPSDLRLQVETKKMSRAEALVQAAQRELEYFERESFKDVIVSMKASSITDTLECNRLLSSVCDVPLHLGVTEAGPLVAGIVKSSIALHQLLLEGIGATIRVSLSDSMENEVLAGREILNAVSDSRGDTSSGVTLVSCPRCGRNAFDTHAFTERWKERLYSLEKDVTIAIMGCAVNGPGEARHADLGITGAGDKVLVFRHGEIVRTVDLEQADQAFQEELEKL